MSIKKHIAKISEKLAGVPVIGTLFEPRPKVSMIRLSGVIADSKRQSLAHHKIAQTIDNAFDVYKCQAVVLVINSPGGSPAQSSLITQHIRRLADEKEIPVYAFIEDVAASGGYWLACAADDIYAQESSIVGSIGVIAASFGLHDFIARHGIERRVHTSGKEKSFFDPFLPEKPSDIKRLKDLQKDIHQVFIDWVNERRAEKLKGADKDLFEGQFWNAGKALDLGIIDHIGDVHGVMHDKFGKTVKIIDFSPDKKWFQGLASIKVPTIQNTIGEDILETAEHKAIWGRYGL